MPESSDMPPLRLTAGGRAIDEETAGQAADWLTLFMSGEASDDDLRRWQDWRAADPDHERAWRHVEAVTGKLKILDPKAAYRALAPDDEAPPLPAAPGRRTLLGLALCAGLAGTTGLVASTAPGWRRLAADYRTGTGRRRDTVLDDGTRLTLNTNSAVDIRFDARRRTVRLVAGELAIVTGHGSAAGAERRRFVVETAEGSIRALGTHFSVRQFDGRTTVAVFESAVEITPAAAAAPSRILAAGQQATFTRDGLGPPARADRWALAWTQGRIVAEDMRLADFLDELGRYRDGFLHCAAAVAGLRVSGVFPSDDTDRVLATLATLLPVRIRRATPYLVLVDARPGLPG